MNLKRIKAEKKNRDRERENKKDKIEEDEEGSTERRRRRSGEDHAVDKERLKRRNSTQEDKTLNNCSTEEAETNKTKDRRNKQEGRETENDDKKRENSKNYRHDDFYKGSEIEYAKERNEKHDLSDNSSSQNHQEDKDDDMVKKGRGFEKKVFSYNGLRGWSNDDYDSNNSKLKGIDRRVKRSYKTRANNEGNMRGWNDKAGDKRSQPIKEFRDRRERTDDRERNGDRERNDERERNGNRERNGDRERNGEKERNGDRERNGEKERNGERERSAKEGRERTSDRDRDRTTETQKRNTERREGGTAKTDGRRRWDHDKFEVTLRSPTSHDVLQPRDSPDYESTSLHLENE
jgi:hypothetical protein